MTLYHGPIRAPLPRDLNWRDQSWRSRIGGRGMVGGLYPGAGFRDFVGGRLVGDDGIHSLPAVTPSADLGIAWDFSGSKVATMGNWGNEFWCGSAAQFTVTVIIDQFRQIAGGGGCIISKADSNGLCWDLWDISTTGNLGRLQWFVRGSGAYLGMYTNAPAAGVVKTDRPNVITVTCDMTLSGSDRIQTWINGVNTSSGYEASGDMSGGLNNNASAVILGYWSPDGSYYWPGKLGGVWFHNRALSAAEIQILHGQTTRYSFLPVHDDDYIFGLAGSTPPPAGARFHLINGRTQRFGRVSA